MPISDHDWEFLTDHTQLGDIALFLGAGFSIDAKNTLGESIPTGGALANKLAAEASMAYEGEPLPSVYEVARKRVGEKRLLEFIRREFSVTEHSEWYNTLPTFVWHRIYSTNIDNLLDKIYDSRTQQRARKIVCPENPEERDQLLGELQLVHLHGHVDAPHAPLTFSFEDFAKQTAKPNPWYRILIEDLFSNPIVFVGTQLHDSPFHHYLEERGQRERGLREFRPKSFLVSPSISDIRREQLLGSNIIPVQCTAEEFFLELRERISEPMTSLDAVRRKIRPDLVIAPKSPVSSATIARHFALVRPDHLPHSPRHDQEEQFFLGAEPDWSDISKHRDADRDICKTILTALLDKNPPKCVFVHGPAGCGKSTTAMRTAVEVSRHGHPSWYATIAERIDLDPLLDHIHESQSEHHHYVFIDVASRHVDSIAAAFARIKHSPRVTLVLVDRTNSFVNKRHSLSELDPVDIRIPDLSDQDIIRLIDRLDHFGMSGSLKGLSNGAKFDAFKKVAEKQILVAMREATSGRGFEQILRGEYSELAEQAKTAYLICCLAVSQGAPGVYKRHLMASLDRSEYTKACVLDDLLRGVLVRANNSGTMLKPRHRMIGRWICNEIADDESKFHAIIRFLLSVSGEIVPNEIRRRSPAFLGYRGLINCNGLWNLFGDRAKALEVYESVRDAFADDFLFWLQYGMANMEAGRYDIAENHLKQSLGIRPNNYQTIHQLGILHLRIAANSPKPELALERANEGIEILQQQIHERGMEDSYPYAAYLHYVLAWYCHAAAIIATPEWESLRNIARRARELYGRDEIIIHAASEVDRLYMMRSVATIDRGIMRPTDPPREAED